MSQNPSDNKPLSEVEHIKTRSRYLRGTIKESLANEMTGTLAADDLQLIKFHGSYQQWDRALEGERKKQKLEPLYSFMIRVRVPAGVATSAQWLGMDDLTGRYGIGTLKLTTRQAFELHGVSKKNLKNAIKGINRTLLDTLAACGDVNRNVMACANPSLSRIHAAVHADAKAIHDHLSPRTRAYHEIWLDDRLVAGGEDAATQDHEPVYGKTYLPRKFKIALAVPPDNDVDVLANDLGFIAIVENGELAGYNISVGGGMGCTFGMPETFPRLATVLGFVPRDKAVAAAETVVAIQRDNGNRSNRKLSRVKYTIERMTVDGFRRELASRLGGILQPARPYRFETNGDRYGWARGEDGRWHMTLFIEGGRVKDTAEYPLRTGLREIARIHTGTFILTGNQNLVIAGVPDGQKSRVEALLEQYRIMAHQKISGARAGSIACVAMPVCPLAFADAETYLPKFMDRFDALLAGLGLKDEPMTVRMTGCPNGCARPFIGEIAMVGRAMGKYNLYLGGGFSGERLNTLYREMLDENQILAELKGILSRFKAERHSGERLGDFIHRCGLLVQAGRK